MSRNRGRIPAYRLHKSSGQARVIINREHVYLGKFGSDESREAYARLIAELAANHAKPVTTNPASGDGRPISVNQTILAYWDFAKSHYAKDGKPTLELENNPLS